jgi:endonuclease YncB( thermonuclease family)
MSMSRDLRTLRRVLALGVLVAVCVADPASADEWLVYLGGGLEPIEGAWAERRGQVIFTKLGGTLVTVPFHEVDLAASAIITWQLGGRRRLPPRPALPEAPSDAPAGPPPACIGARVLELPSAETIEVMIGEEPETVHIACLDAPETQHRFAELSWFGRATLSSVEMEVRRGDEVCLTEQVPPVRDGQGHRIVYVKLADGRDYAAGVIAGGLGLLRPELCGRAARYRALEDRAIAGQAGLWGQMSARAAFAAASHTVAVGAGPGPPRRAGGG